MKKIMRCASLIVAVTVFFSTSMVAFARDKRDDLPTPANCAIDIQGTILTLSGSYTATARHTIKDKAVTLAVDNTGLVLSYPAQGDGVKTVRLGKRINMLTISGMLDALTIADTMDYHYTVNVDAAIGALTINGDVKLLLSGDTAVETLTISDSGAVVAAESGAAIQNTNRVPDSQTYLSLTLRDNRRYTTQASYDGGTGVLSLRAKQAGCTVSDALKDVLLVVKQVNNNFSVPGSWSWPKLDGGAVESGSYLYRFSASDGVHEGAQLIIAFTAFDENTAA
ncbi:hypothetical protein DSECCO2_541260 [anaerobic digester metagenome]